MPDYKTTVRKPWGYEFSIFDDHDISIWLLQIGFPHKSGYLLEKSRTSMHLHLFKTATVICVHGSVDVVTTHSTVKLRPGDYYSIPPLTFHRLEACETYTLLVELETPSNRDDIIRLRDDYGRENQGYDWNKVPSSEVIDPNLYISNDCVRFRESLILAKHSFSSQCDYTTNQLFVPASDYYFSPTNDVLIRKGVVFSPLELKQTLNRIQTNVINLDGFLFF